MLTIFRPGNFGDSEPYAIARFHVDGWLPKAIGLVALKARRGPAI
jgi:hypothetical protein